MTSPAAGEDAIIVDVSRALRAGVGAVFGEVREKARSLRVKVGAVFDGELGKGVPELDDEADE